MITEIVAVISLSLAACFAMLWQRERMANRRRERWLSRILQALAQRDYARSLRLSQALEKDLEKKDGHGVIEDLPTTFGRAVRAIEMQEREERIARRELEDVLASLQDAVLVVDDESRLRFLNAAASDLFGVDIEDVLGAQILEALPSFDLEAAIREALQNGYTHAREVSLYIVPSANGAPSTPNSGGNLHGGNAGRREVLLRVAPVRRSDGAVSGAVAIVQDLTELRRLERVRRDFVANASHELRTPIANIRAAAETILDSSEDPTLVQRFLPRLVSEAERLSHLVSDLLDLARADSALDMPRAPVDVTKVVRDVMRRLDDKARGQQIGLVCDRFDPYFVPGDSAAIEQVAFNLIDNALIYTPPGGRIIIGIETDGEAPAARNLLLSVSDTGIGIPAPDLARIFERFYRVDKARSRAQGGTGLGLAIVKHIVEKHGGHVRVESEVGQGTTFIISLPVA